MPGDADRPDDAPEKTPGAGQQLKRARQEQNLAVAEVAAELHLDEWQILALENEEYARIGAPVYVRGHLRNYAALLKIDSDALFERTDPLGDDPNPAVVATEIEVAMFREKRVHQISMLAGSAVLIAMLVYAGLWVVERINEPDYPAQSVSDIVNVLSLPAARSELADSSDERDETAGGGPVLLSLPTPDTASPETSSVAEPESDLAGFMAPPEKTAVVVLTFSEQSWVEAYDAHGRRLIYEMGPAGSRRSFTGVPPMQVFLGYVDGVEILVDGEPFPLQNARRRGNTAQITIEGN